VFLGEVVSGVRGEAKRKRSKSRVEAIK
jgi:hypothetical protein